MTIRIRLTRDHRLIGPPQVLNGGSGPLFEATRDSAVRAVIQGQPYDMLPPPPTILWKEMDINLDRERLLVAEIDSRLTLQMSSSVFIFTCRRALSLGAVAAAAMVARPRKADAVTVDINQANVQPMPIAVRSISSAVDRATRKLLKACRRSSPIIFGAAACLRRSIRQHSSRRSPTSTPCRTSPRGGPSTRRRWQRDA